MVVMDDTTTESWTHPAVQQRSSAIEGEGLFTTADLPAGTVVARLRGRLVDDVELAKLFAAADEVGGYVDTIMIDDDLNLVLAPDQLIHYGNHSCDPTLWHLDATTLETRRDVTAGEELTIDYATQTVHPDFELACRCGSPRCRGTVTGVDWTDPDWRATYGDHVVPAVRQAIAKWAKR